MILILSAAACAWAQDSHPAWLNASLTGGVQWDGNLFGYRNETPAGQPDVTNRSSLVLSAQGQLACDFAKLFELGEAVKEFSLGYSGGGYWYVDAASEDYASHAVPFVLKAGGEKWDLSVAQHFLFVDGSREAPVYDPAAVNAFGLVFPRERRQQFQDRGQVRINYRAGDFFLRPAAQWRYTDMRTLMRPQTGYQNFVDRSDVNGGLDTGYFVDENFNLFAGYRYGYQYHQSIPWVGRNATNHYHRALFGAQIGDKEWSLSVQAGPTFHEYTGKRLAGQGKHLTRLYAEIAAQFKLDERQRVEFSYTQFDTLSSTSAAAYEYYALALRYAYAMSERWEFGASAAWVFTDYEAPTSRRDGMFTPEIFARWKLNEHVSLRLSYGCDIGYNDESSAYGRDFVRHVVSLGITARY